MPTYSEKLRDPRWQRKRLEVLQRAEFACEDCGAADQTLHVHHRRYRRGAEPWEYPREDLLCLCETCHTRAHEARKQLDVLLRNCYVSDLHRIIGYVRGLTAVELPDTELLSIDNKDQAAGLADYGRFGPEACRLDLTVAELAETIAAARRSE